LVEPRHSRILPKEKRIKRIGIKGEKNSGKRTGAQGRKGHECFHAPAKKSRGHVKGQKKLQRTLKGKSPLTKSKG